MSMPMAPAEQQVSEVPAVQVRLDRHDLRVVAFLGEFHGVGLFLEVAAAGLQVHDGGRGAALDLPAARVGDGKLGLVGGAGDGYRVPGLADDAGAARGKQQARKGNHGKSFHSVWFWLIRVLGKK
jgi:hypothetical protein